MTNLSNPALFTPVRVGPLGLSHRVVMAPLTRSRSAEPGDMPSDLMVEYYGQRASEGGLIISEATNVSVSGRGWYGAPGLYSEAQVVGWKRVTDAVHARGGHMFSQLWHAGRSSNVEATGGSVPVSPSVHPGYWLDSKPSVSTAKGWQHPSPHRALDVAEIPAIVEAYRQAADRAKAAGFDGVELHAANGYLPDQFLQDGCNRRTDAYGGSADNRCRFLLEVVAAMASVWGGDRVAVRIGPSGTWNGMSDSNPTALFDVLVDRLNAFGLAYLHVVEPRIKGNVLATEGQPPVAAERLRKVFKRTIVAAGGFEPDTAESVVVKGDADLVAFGRHFLANPDLPERIRRGRPLNAYDRTTFYTFDSRGYTDYPFYAEPRRPQGPSLVDPGEVRGNGAVESTVQSLNKATAIEAFEALFNRRDFAAAERYWSPDYVQHSAHIPPGRAGLFDLVRNAPTTMRYESQRVVADGDFLMMHGRFSGIGRPANWIAVDVVRMADGLLAEHWDVIEDEATRGQSQSGHPMFGVSFPADRPA